MVLGQRVQEALNVAVLEAHDGNTKRVRLILCGQNAG